MLITAKTSEPDRLMCFTSERLLEDLTHAASQHGSIALKNLYPSKEPHNLSFGLIDFGTVLRLDGQAPSPDKVHNCLAAGILMPIPDVTDFCLFVGKPISNLKENQEPDVLENPFGFGTYSAKPLSAQEILNKALEETPDDKEEELEISAWLVPIQVIQRNEPQLSALTFQCLEQEVYLRQIVLYAQPGFGHSEFEKCLVKNSTLIEKLKTKSWISCYKQEPFIREDVQSFKAKGWGPSYVEVYLFPSLMELVGLCFQFTRTDESFDSPWPAGGENFTLFNACLDDMLEIYDIETKCFGEYCATGIRESVKNLNALQNKDSKAFEVLRSIRIVFTEKGNEELPLEELVHMNIFQHPDLKEKETYPMAIQRLRKPVSLIKSAPIFKVSAACQISKQATHILFPMICSTFTFLEKRFAWCTSENSPFGPGLKPIVDDDVFPTAIFENESEASQALADMVLTHGTGDEITVAEIGCVNPSVLVEKLEEHAKTIRDVMLDFNTKIAS